MKYIVEVHLPTGERSTREVAQLYPYLDYKHGLPQGQSIKLWMTIQDNGKIVYAADERRNR